MFAWFSNLFSSRTARPTSGRALQMVRARYDAAATNGENRRHWANADGLSANAANNPEVRRVLRNRSRYEVANNSYARGIVLTLAHDVVGTGPRLQLLTSNADANNRIEHEFYRWTKVIGLAEKLRTMRTSRAEDGEAFAILTSNPVLPTRVKLDLRLVEADQVATPDLNPLRAGAIDGIVFDESGNPTEYHVLREHPGDGRLVSSLLDYDRIPADSVLHWFRADRPGQARGVPDIMPALPLFAQLRRFTLAVLAAAETAADFAGILYTDAPANGEADAAEPFEPIELEKRALVTMPGGWRMDQMKAEQPATTYAEFKREILNEIARCLNMPANVARADSSGYNYASGRLDHQTYFKAIRVEQSHLESVVLDRILAAWMDEAALIPGLLPDGLPPITEWEHQWFWDGREHVDPQKEATAQATRLTPDQQFELLADRISKIQDPANWNTFSVHWDIGKFQGAEPGCGLERDEDPESPDYGKLKVKASDLAGCGLDVDGDCGLKVKNTDLAGPGLMPVGDCKLGVQIVAGCGIEVTEGTEVSVKAEDLAKSGLKTEGECGLAVDPGCGIWINGGTATTARIRASTASAWERPTTSRNHSPSVAAHSTRRSSKPWNGLANPATSPRWPRNLPAHRERSMAAA